MQYLILLLASTTDMDVSDGGQKQLDPELQGESGDSDMDTDVREKEGAVRGERRGRVKRGRAERGDGSRRGRGGGTGGRAQGRERERGRGRGRGRARGRARGRGRETGSNKQSSSEGTTLGKSLSMFLTCTTVRVIFYTDWDSQASVVDVQPFVQPTGPAVPISQDPLELFSLFFTPDIIQSIVAETNR